ncbi:MAG: Hint domain-containing protein [Rhodobacterales bacterium]|nr:Hint domain-containing protein [Rhodobacterales bacterium]
MVQNTFQTIYLGQMRDLDPDEENYTSEYSGKLEGMTFGDKSNPLHDDIGKLTLDDADGNKIIVANDRGNKAEDLIFEGKAAALDTELAVKVEITFSDGSTGETIMMVLQDTDGRVFLTPWDKEGAAENEVLDDGKILSIKIVSVGDVSYGIYSDVEAEAFICFAGGTLIDTDQGQVDVARVSIGDRVRTMDHGYQEIRWIGGRRVCAVGNVAPIRIRAGALGEGVPARDLRVSPQHRILVRSKIAKRMFDTPEVLIPAKKLLGLQGVTIDTSCRYITYWHFLFDRHEIVFANGTASESLFTGKEALKAVGNKARDEILTLFPELAATDTDREAARPILPGKVQSHMVARHAKNAQPIYQN